MWRAIFVLSLIVLGCIDAQAQEQHAPVPPQIANVKMTHDVAVRQAEDAYHKAVIAADQRYVADLDTALKAAMLNQDINSARALDDQKKAAQAALKHDQAEFAATGGSCSVNLIGATVRQRTAKNLALPGGARAYIYGMSTGAASDATRFQYGSVASANDREGHLSVQLAVTDQPNNQFNTGCSYYAIGGFGVSGYSDMVALYGTNEGPAAGSASVDFTLGGPATVVVVGLASSQQSINFDGLSNMQNDVPAPAVDGTVAMAIGHASVQPGKYSVRELTSAVVDGQDPNHQADLLGVFIFSADAGLVSSQNPKLALPGEVAAPKAAAMGASTLPPPPPAVPPPPPTGDSIGPNRDTQPDGLIHLDFSAVDMDQISAWTTKILAAIPNHDTRDREQKIATDRIKQARRVMSGFKAAGGRDIYAAFWKDMNWQLELNEVIIPLHGAKPDGLAKAMSSLNSLGWVTIPPHNSVVGKALVFSTESSTEKPDDLLGQPELDLADALAGGGNAAVRAVLPVNWAPSTLIWCVMTGEEPLAGGPPDSPLNSIATVSISLCAPPTESISWTFQCADEKSASLLAYYMTEGFAALRDHVDSEQRGEPREDRLSAPDYDHVSRFLAALKPKVVGSRVTTTLGQDAIDNFIVFLETR